MRFYALHLGADHLTLEGGGVISGHQEYFFLGIWWAGYFSPFFPISFLLLLCRMQFFSSDKRLQEICFQNHPPPPPPRVMVGPLHKNRPGPVFSPAAAMKTARQGWTF